MIPEARMNDELSYASTDIERAAMILETIKHTVPNSLNNPYWAMAIQDLMNAKARIGHMRTAVNTPNPEPVMPAELPAAAPAPAPL